MKLDITGLEVAKVLVEYTITVEFDPHTFGTQIEGTVELQMPDGRALSVSQDEYPSAVTELTALVGATVTDAEADEDGTLRLRFDSGAVLTVPVDEDYEAWNVTGPGGYRVISMPGGGLAKWSAI